MDKGNALPNHSLADQRKAQQPEGGDLQENRMVFPGELLVGAQKHRANQISVLLSLPPLRLMLISLGQMGQMFTSL
jgi:hypothetical protein